MSKQLSEAKLDSGRVIPIFALVFVDVLGLTVILPLLHLYAARFGATALEVGLVTAAFPLAQLIGVPVMGALSDRYGRKPLLLVSQFTTFLSFILLGLAGSLEVIILSRLIDGLFGANLATAQAALSDITSEETRAQGLGLTGAAFGMGFVFGPLLSIIALEVGGNLATPAFTAAAYSFISILLTFFVFEETLPPEKRRTDLSWRAFPLLMIGQYLRRPQISVLLALMFAQQLAFFGFEALLGLFTLSRLGLLGQGNALIFLIVGITLVIVQARYIGRWSRRYGERRLIFLALGLLGTGMALISRTPEVPHPFYVREIVEYELRQEDVGNAAAAVIGEIMIVLPENGRNGIRGLVWILVVIVPIAIGAGLIRPSINSLLTKRAGAGEYGAALGASSALVSGANAIAPIIGGLLFQQYGSSTPFLVFGVAMGLLLLLSVIVIRS